MVLRDNTENGKDIYDNLIDCLDNAFTTLANEQLKSDTFNTNFSNIQRDYNHLYGIRIGLVFGFYIFFVVITYFVIPVSCKSRTLAMLIFKLYMIDSKNNKPGVVKHLINTGIILITALFLVVITVLTNFEFAFAIFTPANKVVFIGLIAVGLIAALVNVIFINRNKKGHFVAKKVSGTYYIDYKPEPNDNVEEVVDAKPVE